MGDEKTGQNTCHALLLVHVMSVGAFSPQLARQTDAGCQAGSTQSSHIGATSDRPVDRKTVTPQKLPRAPQHEFRSPAPRRKIEEMYSARDTIPPTAILTGHLMMSTGP